MTKKATKAKPKKVDAGQAFVDQILADVARRRKEKGVASEVAASEAALDAEAAELFAQTNGRDNAPKLDSATALGRIEREGGPTHDRIGDWKPAMQVDPEMLKPLASDIAAARTG